MNDHCIVKKIGLISDTHGWLDDSVFRHFQNCDEIWHGGDIGSLELLESLRQFKPVKAVYGNIDDTSIRSNTPEFIVEMIEGMKFLMIHIGGRPGNYAKGVTELIREHKPDVFICGHSHICAVKRDDTFNMVYMNPGAAGKHGFHHVRTILRFDVDAGQLKNLEVIELGKRVTE